MYAAIGGFISGLGVSLAIVFFKYTKFRKEMEHVIKKGGIGPHVTLEEDTLTMQYDDLRETVAMCEPITPSDVVDCSMAAADKIISELADSFYVVIKKHVDEATANAIISEAVNRMVSDDKEE